MNVSEERGRRRQREPRAGRGPQTTLAPLPTLVNPLPPVEVLPPEALARLIDAAFRLLEEAGLEFRSERVLDLLERNGAIVERGSQMARLGRDMVEHFVALAPAEIPLHARNPERSTVLGGNRININTVGSPPNVSDLERGRRPGSYTALCDLIRLNHALGVCHLVGGNVVEPIDLPVPTRHLDNLHAIFRYTDRPPMVRTVGEFRAMDAIHMAAIAHGLTLDEIRDRPCLASAFNVNSPRRVDEELLDGLIAFAEYGQVVAVTPFTLAGAMSPVTLAGALAQQTAEALAVIALSQMVRAGAPVMFGGFTSNVDMKTGAPAFGTPEYVKATLAGGQVARHFRLPYRSSNVNASNCVDAQSTYESAMSLWAVMMSHANLVHHGLGWLEGGLTASFEKTVIDAEMIRAWAETLKPIEVSDDTLAVEAIKAVPPGGHFFGEAHTLARYETAFYRPLVSDWRNFETWFEDGARTATERAHDIWKRMLAAYEEPALDPAVDEALAAFVARRKQELEGYTG